MSTPTLDLSEKAKGLWELGKSTHEIADACGRSLRWAQVQVKGYKESRLVPTVIKPLPEKVVMFSKPYGPQDQRHGVTWTTVATGRAYYWEAPDNDGTYRPVTELIKNDYVTTYTAGE